MSNSEPRPPYFRLRALDKDRAELVNIEAEIFQMPEHLGEEDAALVGVLDALRRFYESNPTLQRLEIAVVTDDA